MGVCIASFNLHNFNYDARYPLADAFKKEKLANLVKIIRDGDYAIVAFQEIQTPETVNSIVRALNGGMEFGRYQGVHCRSFYEEISDGRLKSPERERRGELAYIWDSDRFSLYKGEAVYKRMYDRLWLALDYFVSGAASILSGALVAGLMDESEDEEKREKRDRGKTVKTVGAAGFAGAGYVAHKYIDAQLKRMRPPFVAFFHPKIGNEIDATRQIRLIDVHSQFGEVDEVDWFSTPSEIRQAEAKYVLKEVFQCVKSECADEGVDNPAAYVLALGDFNRSLRQLTEISNGINGAYPLKRDEIQIAVGIQSEDKTKEQKDRSRTTISVVNQKEVSEGKQREYDYSNDYDHFAFDMDIWRTEDAKRDLDLSSDEFFALSGSDRRAISDHLPIVISSEKI